VISFRVLGNLAMHDEKSQKIKSEEDGKSDTREDLALPSCSARRRIRARLSKHE